MSVDKKLYGKVGFVGAGIMGRPMIRNLLKAGVDVHVYDILPETRTALADENIPVADSLKAVAEGADVVITMLPDTPHVRSALLGDEGLVQAMSPGSVIIDMSTISASAIREIAETLKKDRQIDLLDAPVSGGVKGAINGTLSIMVGGDKAAYEKVTALLGCMGTSLHVGPAGMGQVFKMCNQLMVAMHIQALCEAFALCRSQGGDLDALRDALRPGAAGSWMLENLGPQVIAKDDSAGFRIDLQLKDLRLAGEVAFAAGVPLPGLALATSMYLEARAHKEGSNGNQAMFRTYDRLTNQAN